MFTPPLGGPVKAQLWDTAGQERFSKVLLPTYFRKAKGCVLVYDLTNLSTLKSLEGKWLKECEGIKGIIVGNKCDLGEYDEQVRERNTINTYLLYKTFNINTFFHTKHPTAW